MIIESRRLDGYVKHHGMDYGYEVVSNDDFYIMSDRINNEYWYSVYRKSDENAFQDYEFSSLSLNECLDYCNILYYNGEEYR